MYELLTDAFQSEVETTEISDDYDYACWDSDKPPGDIPIAEIWCVLRTPGGRLRAGKSYRPDPSGARTAVKAADYKMSAFFLCSLVSVHNLEDVLDLLRDLSTDDCAFLIRGMLFDWGRAPQRHREKKVLGYFVYRRSVNVHGSAGDFTDYSRRLQMLDLDGVSLPDEMSVVTDPEACILWVVDRLLPPEFRETSFVYQLSSSAGLTKRDNELNVHLWFFTNEGYENAELRTWARWWNAKQQCRIIDPMLFTAVQPHYTNEPELLDGLIDPLAGRRLGLISRTRRTAQLYMPAVEEVITVLNSRQSRAVRQYCCTHRSKTTPSSEASQPDAVSSVDPGVEQGPVLDTGGDAIPGGPYFDAVRLAPSWQEYLMAIGFEGHIRTQIRAAIGSYFYERGSRGDRRLLKAEIARAIEESPFLDSSEPWSRPRKDARDYLNPPGHSNVDEMIVDIAALQTARERFACEPCEPSWQLPPLTAAEVFSRIKDTICEVVIEAAKSRLSHQTGDALEALFQKAPSIAVNCSTGTGKTEAMVSSIAVFLYLDTTVRVAIAVPTHKLGQGLADRINAAYGSDVAAEWYGTDHPDPQNPQEKMCRLAEVAKELVSVGGKLQLLCSRRREHMEYCQHHSAVAGQETCGYQRQQTLDARNQTRVWIIPATMLAAAPPVALKRPKHGLEGDFDLLVIDEAPWFSLIPDEPAKLPIEWLSPEWWAARNSHATEVQKARAIDTLTKISDTLNRRPLGEVPVDEFRNLGIEASDVGLTRRTIWKFKVDLRQLVTPGWTHGRLKKALAAVAPHNKRVVAVAEALYTIMLHVSGRLGPSGVELAEEGSKRHLCLRRRQDIDPAWLRAPMLYLDAADIGSFQIARAWLPDLELKVDAKAKAPNMRVTQLVDSQLPYRRLTTRGNDKEAIAENNRDKLADLITSLGSEGLVICPKKLRLAWEGENRLPPGWMVWNFGSIRGRDEARAVPRLVVVSRPLPSPAVVETMAETIFGRRVERLPTGAWYPIAPVGRLMAEGTGRRALALRHPDPLAEAVRFAVCEGELVQAVGRGRGVRRSDDRPLDVLILTNVAIPLPIDELTTFRALLDSSGPLGLLAARGVVPLDYDGIARALPEWFADAAKVKDWFRYRPEARSKLKAIQWMAREGAVDLREFRGISHRESTMEDSAKLAAYRYRRPRCRQSNIVLVNDKMHANAQVAVEAVVGSVDLFQPADDGPRRKPREGTEI
jgi:hypothetical protein